ncbi:hypothetical protein ACTHTN_20380, partial [Neisseria sp. P0015.S006]
MDLTADLKKCGLSDQEMMHQWTQNKDIEKLNKKIRTSSSPKIKSLLPARELNTKGCTYLSAQIIYSWKQTIKAN